MGGVLNALAGESRVSFDSEALPDGSRFAAVGRFTAIARPDVAWPAEVFRVAAPNSFGAVGPDGFDVPDADLFDPDGLDAARPDGFDSAGSEAFDAAGCETFDVAATTFFNAAAPAAVDAAGDGPLGSASTLDSAGTAGFDVADTDVLDAADADARPLAPGVSTTVAERDDLEAAAFSVGLDAADFLAGAFEGFFGLALAVLTVTMSASEECSSDESSESSASIAARSASESEEPSKFWSVVSLPLIDFVFLAGGSSSSTVSTWSCVRKRRFLACAEDSASL